MTSCRAIFFDFSFLLFSRYFFSLFRKGYYFFLFLPFFPTLSVSLFSKASSELLAICGPSGAGKTTLFSVLSGRGALEPDADSSICINGIPCSRSDIASRSGFVFQDCNFHSCLTVSEVIRFAASVKLSKVLSQEAKEKRISLLLDLFDLRHIASSKVGDAATPGISGGEKVLNTLTKFFSSNLGAS